MGSSKKTTSLTLNLGSSAWSHCRGDVLAELFWVQQFNLQRFILKSNQTNTITFNSHSSDDSLPIKLCANVSKLTWRLINHGHINQHPECFHILVTVDCFPTYQARDSDKPQKPTERFNTLTLATRLFIQSHSCLYKVVPAPAQQLREPVNVKHYWGSCTSNILQTGSDGSKVEADSAGLVCLSRGCLLTRLFSFHFEFTVKVVLHIQTVKQTFGIKRFASMFSCCLLFLHHFLRFICLFFTSRPPKHWHISHTCRIGGWFLWWDGQK